MSTSEPGGVAGTTSAKAFPGATWPDFEGAAGREIRDRDWSSHPLGPLSHWPRDLQTALRIVLEAGSAIWLGWGREFYFFGNDACRALLPADGPGWPTGAPARRAWKEHWSVLEATADAVFTTGRPAEVTVGGLDQDRPGAAGGNWHVFSFSPLRDEAGEIAGLLCLLRKDAPSSGGSERRLRELVEVMPAAVYTCDQEGRITYFNRRAAELWGREPRLGDPDHRFCGSFRLWRPDGTPLRHGETAMALALKNGRSARNEEVVVEQPSGVRRTVSANVDPVHDAAGRLAGAINVFVDVTERRQAEQAWREGEERLRLATRTGKIGLWEWDVVHDRVTWTDSLYPIHGVDPATFDASVKGFTQLVHPEDRARVGEAIRRSLELDEPYELEFRALRPDGGVVWLFTNATVVRVDGRPARMLGATVDISERKGAELARGRLAAIVESSDDAIISKNLDGIIASWNRGAERLFGYTAEEIVGQSVLRLIPPERQDEEPRILEQIRSGARVEHYETRRRRKDGTLFDVSLSISPIKDATGAIVGAAKILRDITQQKRTERELRRSEQLYRAIGESIDYGIWVCDREGRNIYVSESFLRLVGLTLQQCSEYGWGEVLHPDDAEATLAAWRECIRGETFWEREHRVRGVDGRWHPILARGVPVRDVDGSILCWAGINLDISRLKQKEEALRESEERFRTLADNIAAFAWTADQLGSATWYNKRWYDYTGTTFAEMRDRGWERVQHPDHLERVRRGLQRCLEKGEVWEDTFPIRRHDGVYRWFLSRAVPIRDDHGRVIRWFGTNTDITEQREAELALERARDEAVAASRAKDDFLAALSHELRTPLNPVLLLSSEGAENPELPETVRADFESIRRNVSLEARLIDDLLDLTRISRGKLLLEFARHDVHAVLRDAIAIIESDADEKGVSLVLELKAQEPGVRADAVRLQQVFWNIIKNAVKFTPEGGKVRVASRTVASEGRVEIEVTDTGIGMTEAEIGRIFEAFSQGDHALGPRTHQFGGLGLGLTISRVVMQLHGGSIRAFSSGPGKGSTFIITLPLGGKEKKLMPVLPRAPTQARDQHGGSGDGGRILLVEDHAPTRAALERLLERRGFGVTSVGTMQEALATARTERFDLLISDLGLPDGSGCDLMQTCARDHGMAGIALTGYGMEEDLARSRAAGFSAHLIKPVGVKALDQAVAEVLSRRAAED